MAGAGPVDDQLEEEAEGGAAKVEETCPGGPPAVFGGDDPHQTKGEEAGDCRRGQAAEGGEELGVGRRLEVVTKGKTHPVQATNQANVEADQEGEENEEDRQGEGADLTFDGVHYARPRFVNLAIASGRTETKTIATISNSKWARTTGTLPKKWPAKMPIVTQQMPPRTL